MRTWRLEWDLCKHEARLVVVGVRVCSEIALVCACERVWWLTSHACRRQVNMVHMFACPYMWNWGGGGLIAQFRLLLSCTVEFILSL